MEKKNLVNLINERIYKLCSLKYVYCNDSEIFRFSESVLEDKVKELSDIMNKYIIQCGIIMLCGSILIGMMIYATSFAITRNIILSLIISIVSLCAIWVFMKKRSSKNIGSEILRSNIEYDKLVEVDTVKKHYDFWNSTNSRLIESLTDVIKVNPLMIPFRNTLIATQNYVTFKTRYYDNAIRLKDFYIKIFDDIWLRNKNADAEESVEYFIKNTSAWSRRKETYQMIMFICTELTFMYLFLSLENFDQSIIKKNDIRLCIDEFMRCVKESDKIDELTAIDKILSIIIDVDYYCQKKLDDINAICN